MRRQHAEALLQVVEAAADSECGRCENYRIELIEELFAEDVAHVDRRGREKHAAAAALVPVDVAFLFALHQEREFAPRFSGAPREGDDFLGLRRDCRKFGFCALHGCGQIVVRLAILIEEGMSFGGTEGIAALALGETLEEGAGPLAQAREMLAQRRGLDAQDAKHAFRVAREFFEAVARKLTAEIIARHVFDFVRFIENDRGIFGQDRAEIVLADGEIGEKEMMIHDDQVGFVRPLVHRRDEATLKFRALLPGAQVAARVDAVPKLGVVGQERQFAAVAGFGKLLPVVNL